MVKYCQECGNPSYDGATICGNCGAKFPPKSEINSKPPSSNAISENKEKIETKPDFNFSKNINIFKKNISKKLNEIELSKDKKVKEDEKQSKSQDIERIVSFKEESKGIENPVKKFKKTIENTKKESEKAVPEKEEKNEIHTNKEDESQLKISNLNSNDLKFKFTKKNIAIIIIVLIILIAIVGASIMTMTNTNSKETLYFSDGPISFYYPGNWSMYNNTNTNDGSGEIAFKTPNDVLIGYTTITSEDITLSLISSEINRTAISLGGSIISYKDITINNISATDITVSSGEHGYSRYISIIHNGVYYSFVINNGKTNNVNDLNSLNSTDIQNMINSIKFSDLTLNNMNSEA